MAGRYLGAVVTTIDGKKIAIKRYTAHYARGAKKSKTALIPGGMRRPFGTDDSQRNLARYVSNLQDKAMGR